MFVLLLLLPMYVCKVIQLTMIVYTTYVMKSTKKTISYSEILSFDNVCQIGKWVTFFWQYFLSQAVPNRYWYTSMSCSGCFLQL